MPYENIFKNDIPLNIPSSDISNFAVQSSALALQASRIQESIQQLRSNFFDVTSSEEKYEALRSSKEKTERLRHVKREMRIDYDYSDLAQIGSEVHLGSTVSEITGRRYAILRNTTSPFQRIRQVPKVSERWKHDNEILARFHVIAQEQNVRSETSQIASGTLRDQDRLYEVPDEFGSSNLVQHRLDVIIQNSNTWREILDRFNTIGQRLDNWDEYGSKKPIEFALNRAKIVVKNFFDAVVNAEYTWFNPFISSDEYGYITVEWYRDERELHLLVKKDKTEYLQVWGIDIDAEMTDGIFSAENYLNLWKWLLDV